MDVAVTDDGLVLKARQVIDKAQAYCWPAEWQQAEREAQADLDAGRSRRFDSEYVNPHERQARETRLTGRIVATKITLDAIHR